MPAHRRFFKRADFGRSRNAIGCFVKGGYNARDLQMKGPHVAAPHNLSPKFLLRMRREDRPATLACMDQPQVLRQVLSRCRENALATARSYNIDFLVSRNFDRTRLPSRTATACHRATGAVVIPNCCNSTTDDLRAGLHLRRSHQERQTVLAPRPWSSSLLATQRNARNASDREADS